MPESIDRSRRGFFTGSLLTREGKQKIKQQIKPRGIIPPGLSAAVDAGLCQHCAAECVTACPQHIIKQHPKDHALSAQPWLDFEQGGCTFCGECNIACPHTFVDDSSSKPTQLGKARISENQCYTWSGIVCMSCVSVCPLDLIKFEHAKPTIQLDACTGCGSCVAICPASAISIQAKLNP